MKLFKKITESPEVLADFLATKSKGENKGCAECEFNSECTGKETCKQKWIDALNAELSTS